MLPDLPNILNGVVWAVKPYPNQQSISFSVSQSDRIHLWDATQLQMILSPLSIGFILTGKKSAAREQLLSF